MLSTLFFVEPGRSVGQGTMLWQTIQPATHRPAGNVWSYVPGSVDVGLPQYTPTETGATSITAIESGRDWWASHENVYDEGGALIGIVACGWSFPANWTYTDDCFDGEISGNPLPNPFGQETYESRWGTIRQIVGYYSPAGVLQWFRFLEPGNTYGVIVDREGSIIVVGEGGSHEPLPEIGSVPRYFNPVTNNLVPFASLTCPTAGQLTIAKLDQSGNLLWNHFYNTESDASIALGQPCVGQQVVETNADNEIGYRVVGWQRTGGIDRPCIIQVDADGMLQFATRLNSIPGIIDASDTQVRALYISRCPFGAGEKFAVTGYRAVADNSGRTSAWVMYMDDAIGTVTDAEWTKDLYDEYTNNGNPFGINVARNQMANRVALTMDGATPRVVWPLLLDYVRRSSAGAALANGTPFGTTTNREARGRVFKFDGSTGTLLWGSPDLGPMRAFDLYFSLKPLPNGDYALTSTKAAPGHGIDDPLDYAELPVGVQTCLTSATGLGYDPDGPTLPQVPVAWAGLGWDSFGHYGTDSYVAILRNGTGSLVWRYQWNEGSGPLATTCYPENYRQRQCDFDITVSPEGDLLVCGNTGHNKDDAYLARIQPSCDAQADYSVFEAAYPLNANNEHHITSSITWNTSMNVRGSIIIDAGGSLTMTNGATISFADSRLMGYPCNIVVMPHIPGGAQAGNLTITDNATVTSLVDCPFSMWDGVQVLGATGTEALWKNGEFRITDGGSIRNAMAAVTNCRVDCMNPTTATATERGGVIIADGGSFISNRYDVVMRQYNSGLSNDFTNSLFYNSTFATNAPLNYPTLFCETHLHFDRVNRMKVGGNTFAMNSGVIPYAERGTGIFANRTAVQVLPMCTGGDWDPLCTLANQTTTNQFSLLFRGVDATSNDPSKIMWVRDAVFVENAAGIRLNGVTASILRNQLYVPDIDLAGTGIDAPYGIGVFECTGFTVENNRVQGNSISQTYSVGAIFSNTNGTVDAANASNRYYNNTFDDLRIGTIIQLDNDGPANGDGLEIKCNDYGNRLFESQNTFDISFTGTNPTVGDRQGSAGLLQSSPAGNTFSPLCGVPETQMSVPLLGINTFTYWHHDPGSTSLVVLPTCRTNPPLINTWYVNSTLNYDKLLSCPGYVEFIGGGEEEQSRMMEAEMEYATLKSVYDAERDGGDTEGLKETASDPTSSSSDVRSALMLAAPKVSTEVWAEVFRRAEPLNPWHMAQALMANSPLQPEVARMMEESDLTSFYKQLVYGAQGDGVNSLVILESEMAHWKHQHDHALNQLTAHALVSEDGGITVEDVLAFEAAHPQMGTRYARIRLLMASGQYAAAKALVEAALEGEESDGSLEVLNMYLAELIAGGDGTTATPELIEDLQSRSILQEPGHVAAENWLRTLGVADVPERIILPSEQRIAHPALEDDLALVEGEQLSIFPNPAKSGQDVYMVVRLEEGMASGVVRILDPVGRLVSERRTQDRTTIIELPTGSLSGGLYVAALSVDGVAVRSVKFQLTR